jgi:hypothetical protein
MTGSWYERGNEGTFVRQSLINFSAIFFSQFYFPYYLLDYIRMQAAFCNVTLG